MGNNVNSRSTTTLQIGRMHRTLMTCNTAKYAWGYDPEDYTLTTDETWDFRIKFYQDIVVPAGVTLTVKCEVHMVPEAMIRVEPGGRLVIDGGIIRDATFAPARWNGILVMGNANLPQTYADQGVLELINGGTIQGANMGAWVMGGGIVRALGSQQYPVVFRNCARSVVMAPYLWPQTPGQWQYDANASLFVGTRFETNEDFLPEPSAWPFAEHARLNNVYGVRLRGCTFINTRQDITTSAELGYGINAHDAHFFAISHNRFEGLDHGIHSTGTANHARFEARQNVFKNNICGVYINGQYGCNVTSNRFVMGLRDVDLTNPVQFLWEQFHRGIFTHETNKFWIEGNVLERDDDPLATSPAEGIVIGYVREANEVVRSNRALNINRGFVGEGINAHTDPAYTFMVGLQFLCNSNSSVPINFWSRIAAGGPDPDDHTIRTYQGDPLQPADDQFDGVPPDGDFRVTSIHPIKYFHRDGVPFTPTAFEPTMFYPWELDTPPPTSCPTYSDPPPALMLPDKEETWTELFAEKLAYGNLRYQFMQLLDGGDKDEVVAEITGAWPQDFLELRNYLLARSPYLSVEVLRDVMRKQGLPEAIKAEVIIANPEAAQRDGFIRWLMNECPYPLPEYLVGAIVASWEERTYRATLEAQMADHHARHEQAAMYLLHHFLGDTVSVSQDSVLHVWQQVRTPAARYSEANLLMDRHAYTAAAALITALPVEHELRGPDVAEQQRMLQWIAFREALHNSNRTLAELDSSEVDQLETLIGDDQDRPAAWIANTLCFHYDRCRPVYTGGESGPKSLPYAPRSKLPATHVASLTLKPNPAAQWVAVNYDLPKSGEVLVLKDDLGRPLLRQTISGNHGQAILDLGTFAKGAYILELTYGGGDRVVEKLVIQ